MAHVQYDDGSDTALARLLHDEQAVELELAQVCLEEVRQRRSSEPGLTLASLLIDRGLARKDVVEGALVRLGLDPTELELGLPRTEPAPRTEPTGTIGPYKLLRELARGGMGVVYVAFDPRLEREIALKVMHAGELATVEEIERFQIEARAAGRLRHPNIVQVHEVGQAEGVWFLAMDLIPGQSLGSLLSGGPLEPREAARILEIVAQAIQAAHLQAILHRDLKPQNVLLDEERTPYLTDFGLAKDVGRTDGPTLSGAVLGTPAYMAPEQAEGEIARLDARTDVYGLGALLFALLTGRAPFKGGGVFEILDKVSRRLPPPPSSLAPGIDRDLETICLKCLEKEPASRYQSARDLAEDLARYLRHEPILARPPTALQRFNQWIRRNRTLANAVGVVAVASFAVISISTALFVVRLQEKTREAEEARSLQEESARRADAQAKIARDALENMIRGVQNHLEDLDGGQIQAFRETALRDALARLLELQALDESESEPRRIGEVCLQIVGLSLVTGRTEEADLAMSRLEVTARKTLEANPDQPEALWCWLLWKTLRGRVFTSRTEWLAAQSALEEVTQELRQAVSRFPTHTPLKGLLADALYWGTAAEKGLGNSTAARAKCIEALGWYEELPSAEVKTETLTYHLGAIRLLCSRDLETPFPQGLDLARAHLDRFEHLLAEAPKSWPRGRAVATASLILGDRLVASNQLEAATAAYERAREVVEELTKADPVRIGPRRTLARALDRLGKLYSRKPGDPRLSLEPLEQATLLFREIHGVVQGTSSLHELATSLEHLNDVKAKAGLTSEALQGHLEVLAIRERLALEQPDNLSALRTLGVSQERIGTLLQVSEPIAALKSFREGAATRRSLVRRFPLAPNLPNELALVLEKLSGLLVQLSDVRGSLKAADEAVSTLRELLEKKPTLHNSHSYANALSQRARAHLAADQAAAALLDQEKSLAIRRQLLNARPKKRRYRRDLSVSLTELAQSLKLEPNPDRALRALKEAADNHRDLVKEFPRYRAELKAIEQSIQTTTHQATLVRGSQTPASATDYLVIAGSNAKNPVVAAAAYAKSFELEPRLEGDPRNRIYLKAAVASARGSKASRGQVALRLRALALRWLAQHVTRCRRVIETIDEAFSATPESEQGGLEGSRLTYRNLLHRARVHPAFADLRQSPEFKRLFFTSR